MHPALHNIVMGLDTRIIDITDYFNWTQDEKDGLFDYIHKCFIPVLRKGEKHKQFLMASIWRIIIECEDNEEYEQADIMTRCLINLETEIW